MNLSEESIQNTQLLSDETFESILSITNDIERVKEINRLRKQAKDLNILKDFNDILKLKSKRASIPKREINFDKQYCNMNGTPKNLQVNVYKLLKHYEIDCRYNCMTKDIEIDMDRSDEIAQDNKNNIIEEDIFDKCVEHDFTSLSKDRLTAMLMSFADVNKYNPARDYLTEVHKGFELTLEPDTPSELKKLCNTIKSDMDTDFKELLIKTWLISCVKAAYSDNGISAHGVLVLQGKQGLGKTSWFRSIVPNPSWFKDGITLDVKNKDSILRVLKYWIVELGEIGATVKKDFEALKAFLTQDSDELRRAFARKESRYPRGTIFCGSVNQEEFLQDDTGNRRFWTIPVTEIDYEHDVDIDKMWAEVVQLYHEGGKWWLDHDEQKILSENNKQHNVQDYTDTLIDSRFKWDEMERYWMTSTDVFREMGEPIGITLCKISRSLTKRGVELKRVTNGRYYAMPLPKQHTEKQYQKAPIEWGKWGEE